METGSIDQSSKLLRRAFFIRCVVCIGLPVLLLFGAVSSLVSSAQSIKSKTRRPDLKAKPVVSDGSEFMTPEMQRKAIKYYSAKKAQEAKERAAALKAGKPDPYPDSNSGWDNTENWFKHTKDGPQGITTDKPGSH